MVRKGQKNATVFEAQRTGTVEMPLLAIRMHEKVS